MLEEVAKPKGRGKGKKPALAITSLRLETHVLEYFKTKYKSNMQRKMRAVLTEYVTKEMQNEYQ